MSLDAIRKKLAAMNAPKDAPKKKSEIPTFKVETAKQYRVRFLPYESATGLPYEERVTYWLETPSGKKTRISLKPTSIDDDDSSYDPILKQRIQLFQEAKKLESEGDVEQAESLREFAKTLKQKKEAIWLVLDRDDEAAGWKIFRPNYTTNKNILNLFADEDTVQFMHPEEGLDVKITATVSNKVLPKDARGNTNAPKGPVFDITVSTAPKPTPILADSTEVKKLMESLPKFDTLFPVDTFEAASKKFEEYLDSLENSTPKTETTRGASDEEEVVTKSAEPKTPVKAEAKKKAAPAKDYKAKLDSAFEDLDGDDSFDD